ncbi:ATP-binding protein [Nonomuraea wenchangensis]|nr:ATP-binding protein [Nonomuraea wenchangensis]
MRRHLRHEDTEMAFPEAPHMTALKQFPATEISVFRAREWARSLLSPGAPRPVLDDALLLLSEVVTNAITHSDSGRAPAGVVTVRIARIGTAVQVEVTDAGSSTSAPAVQAPTLDDDTGRGLWMVVMLADSWGSEHDENHGKVWFLLTGRELRGDGKM